MQRIPISSVEFRTAIWFTHFITYLSILLAQDITFGVSNWHLNFSIDWSFRILSHLGWMLYGRTSITATSASLPCWLCHHRCVCPFWGKSLPSPYVKLNVPPEQTRDAATKQTARISYPGSYIPEYLFLYFCFFLSLFCLLPIIGELWMENLGSTIKRDGLCNLVLFNSFAFHFFFFTNPSLASSSDNLVRIG